MKYTKSHNAMHHEGDHSHHTFDNTELFAKRFDAPERDEWQKPGQVIDSLDLPDDSTVAEIGAGTGYFTVRLAKHLKKGKVIVLESSPKMVEYLEDQLGKMSLTNVDILLSETGNQICLPEKADLIMCVDSYHHVTERVSYFSSLKQQLRRSGRIVIIDRPADSPDAPPHEHQTPPELVEKEMTQAGLELFQKFDFLLPYQFYFSFKPIPITKNKHKK